MLFVCVCALGGRGPPLLRAAAAAVQDGGRWFRKRRMQLWTLSAGPSLSRRLRTKSAWLSSRKASPSISCTSQRQREIYIYAIISGARVTEQHAVAQWWLEGDSVP